MRSLTRLPTCRRGHREPRQPPGARIRNAGRPRPSRGRIRPSFGPSAPIARHVQTDYRHKIPFQKGHRSLTSEVFRPQAANAGKPRRIMPLRRNAVTPYLPSPDHRPSVEPDTFRSPRRIARSLSAKTGMATLGLRRFMKGWRSGIWARSAGHESGTHFFAEAKRHP